MLGGAAIVVYNGPDDAVVDFVFTPLLFAIAWLAGLALQERSARAEAAEERAAYAEREREAAARVAVAEERARIARELHDIVAHAVSVMVLQVGAVRHRLPPALEEDRDALQSVERAGRTALAEMRQLLGAMRERGEEAELAPQPGLGDLDALLAEIGARRPARAAARRGRAGPAPARDRPVRLPDHPGGPDQHAQARARRPGRRRRPLRARRAAHRGPRRRRRRDARATASATASSACASA